MTTQVKARIVFHAPHGATDGANTMTFTLPSMPSQDLDKATRQIVTQNHLEQWRMTVSIIGS